jgi:8-amino-7-oxononanoate synthase
MIDFTSSLYLGLRHASADLRPWARLTTGVPAVLGEPAVAQVLTERLAQLIGVEAAVLARSTLHAFWDLIIFLGRVVKPATVLVDSGTYAIARWGVERAHYRGLRARAFRHHDTVELAFLSSELNRSGRRPIVVADGFCAGCGEFAPAAEYLDVARRLGGLLVLDDTQALGVAGPSGGGSLRRAGVSGPAAVVVNSLAKGFGAPLAFVGGSQSLVQEYRRASETRAHSSPPSSADMHAAMHALDVNRVAGALRRRALYTLIGRFRRGLARLGLPAPGHVSPIQTLGPVPGIPAEELHTHLAAAGVRTVLHRPTCGSGDRVTFLLNAGHTARDIDIALAGLASAIGVDRSA